MFLWKRRCFLHQSVKKNRKSQTEPHFSYNPPGGTRPHFSFARKEFNCSYLFFLPQDMWRLLCLSPPKGTWPHRQQLTAQVCVSGIFKILMHQYMLLFSASPQLGKCLAGVPSQHFRDVYWSLCEHKQGWNSWNIKFAWNVSFLSVLQKPAAPGICFAHCLQHPASAVVKDVVAPSASSLIHLEIISIFRYMYLGSTSWRVTVFDAKLSFSCLLQSWGDTFIPQVLHFSILLIFVNTLKVKAGSSKALSLFPAHFVRNIFSSLAHDVNITGLGCSICINRQLDSL